MNGDFDSIRILLGFHLYLNDKNTAGTKKRIDSVIDVIRQNRMGKPVALDRGEGVVALLDGVSHAGLALRSSMVEFLCKEYKTEYEFQKKPRQKYLLHYGIQCNNAPGIDELLTAMASRNWDEKIRAAKELAQMGEGATKAESAAIRCMKRKGANAPLYQWQSYCARIPGNIKSARPEAHRAMMEIFEEENNASSAQGAVQVAMLQIGSPALPALQEILKSHPNTSMCVWAARILGYMKQNGRGALEGLVVASTEDSDPFVRRVASQSAQMIRNEFPELK